MLKLVAKVTVKLSANSSNRIIGGTNGSACKCWHFGRGSTVEAEEKIHVNFLNNPLRSKKQVAHSPVITLILLHGDG